MEFVVLFIDPRCFLCYLWIKNVYDTVGGEHYPVPVRRWEPGTYRNSTILLMDSGRMRGGDV